MREQIRDANQRRLREAGESLERYLALAQNADNAVALREQLAAIRFHARLPNSSDASRSIFTTSELTTRVNITRRPEARYTDAARQAGISGLVVLRAVFTSDSRIENILVLRSLGYGLTESATEALRRIRFEPATKDGQPVSTFVTVVYEFQLASSTSEN